MMFVLVAPGQTAHRVRNPDAVKYHFARASAKACGCHGCKVSLWAMRTEWWMRHHRPDFSEPQRRAFASHGIRLLDAAETLYCEPRLLALELLTVDRGIAAIKYIVERMEGN